MKLLGLILAALLVGSCSPPNDPPATANRPSAAATELPEIVVGGCDDREQDLCWITSQLTGGQLTIWVDVEASATLQVRIDGTPSSVEPWPVDGGQRLQVKVPLGAARLELQSVQPAWAEPFRLPLRWRAPPLAAAVARYYIRQNRSKAEIVALLEHAAESSEGLDRLATLQLLRRVHGLSNTPQSLARAEEIVRLAEALEQEVALADIAAVQAFRHITAKDLPKARPWLERLERLAPDVPKARAWAAYYRGMAATAEGDLTAAVRSMAQSQRAAKRLGQVADVSSALEQHAVLLGELGQTSEALALIREGLDSLDDPRLLCKTQARALGNLGWAQLRLVQNDLDDDVPWSALERALALVEGPCPNTFEQANQRLNLTLAGLVSAEYGRAQGYIDDLRADGVPAGLEPWTAEFEARLDRVAGRWDRMPPLVLEPERSGEVGLDWSVTLRRAQALAELGLHEAAADAFMQTEAMLDDALITIGADIGKEMFLASRSVSARGLVQQLLVLGRAKDAACRARLARGRALRTIDRSTRIAGLNPKQRREWNTKALDFLAKRRRLQQEGEGDWKFSDTKVQRRKTRRAQRDAEALAEFDDALRQLLTDKAPKDCTALAPATDGEALLLVSDTEHGTLVMLVDAQGVASVQAPRADPQTPEHWAEAALSDLSERLSRATRIRLAIDGSARALPWPRLLVGEGTLLDLAPLVHTLDLPLRDSAPARASQALVIGDPLQDLPNARREAVAAHESLADAPWSPRRNLLLGTEASRSTITEALGTATVVHYAGHGVHRGSDGWNAALLLADGELTVADLLALPAVPSTVILAGCDTGTGNDQALAGGLNIGRAFVLAGAEQVLVADGPIHDELAQAIGEAVAARLATQARPDLAKALQTVQRQLAQQRPDEPWWRLHVLVP
ncbi:MAG: CHAT domain-containing protein [Myxococcota bacterium]